MSLHGFPRTTEASVAELDALLAAPVVASLMCEGCLAQVAIRSGPDVAVVEGMTVFVSAHAACAPGRAAYRIDLVEGATGRPYDVGGRAGL